MAKVYVKLNRAEVRRRLNASDMQAVVLERCNQVKAAANSIGSGEYKADVQAGKVRAHGRVSTTDFKSMASNRKHNTLLKALGHGQ